MENHRTNQAYEDALVIKRFSFMFVSNYVSLFYIAFVRPWVGDGEESCAVSSVTGLPDCTVELEAQLLSMIITKTTVQQALEILLPWLMTFVQHQLGRWRAYRARRKSASAAAAGDVEEGAANPTSRFSRYVRESMLPPFSTTIEDYAEMVRARVVRLRWGGAPGTATRACFCCFAVFFFACVGVGSAVSVNMSASVCWSSSTLRVAFSLWCLLFRRRSLLGRSSRLSLVAG